MDSVQLQPEARVRYNVKCDPLEPRIRVDRDDVIILRDLVLDRAYKVYGMIPKLGIGLLDELELERRVQALPLLLWIVSKLSLLMGPTLALCSSPSATSSPWPVTCSMILRPASSLRNL